MNLSADALEIFLQKIPMGIAVFNRDYTLRQCNPIWCKHVAAVTHIRSEQIKAGLPVKELFAQETVDLHPFFAVAFAGKTVSKELLPLTTKEATYYWDIFFSSLRENGRITGALMIVTDVTRRKEAEVAAQTAEQALLTLMDSLPGMAYRGPLSPNREMELVNKGVQELTGYFPEQLIHPAEIPFGTLIHKDDRENVWQELNTAVQEKRPFELSYRIYTADGQIKWVLEQGSGLFLPDGNLLAVEGFISDITERMLTQQILERRVIDRTQKLSALYEMMTVSAEQGDLQSGLQQALSWVLTAVHGQAGCIQLLNHPQNELHLAAESSLPAKLRAQITLVSAQKEVWAQILSTEQPIMQTEGFLLSDTNLRVHAGLRITARDHLLGVLNIWRNTPRLFSESDIALMIAAAEQIGTTIENARLRRDNERLLLLDERNRLARELHDAVTQSLYSLTLFAEANQRFAQMEDLENVQQYSARIGETAQQSLKEMRLLLHNLRPSILQQAGLIGALQQRLDSVEKRANIDTKLVYDNDITFPPQVEETLFHIAEEALNNSLKHAQATAVTITLSQTGSMITLTILDNGCGFDQMALPDMGGIGLLSMQERAHLLGGALTINSSAGKTAVTVQFDLEQTQKTNASQNLLDLLQDGS